MAKFNVVQKKRRTFIANEKRRIHGDPASGKLHQRIQPKSISGKRQRKLLKKWRREQKEAVEKGLITMQDVEMAAADEPAEDAKKTPVKFPMKRAARLRLKKNTKKSQKPVGEASNDSMVE
ncbi:hypothetical protein SASPL_103329 [Salvia splendens]|uniref:Uncharacterized protein n=1 Tax=Salvia splendens TaxID=180675 RepID=A0A8X9ADX0_SALSN|nr:uncharacterized protein LOC121802438 [Salvia splendens]KAG6438388.1 hypothetical protein SASPL_103329 [Salvia splendens]